MIKYTCLLLLIIALPLLSAASQPVTYNLNLVVNERCGDVYNIGDDVYVNLTVGNFSLVKVWVELPDGSERIIKEFKPNKRNYEFKVKLAGAPGIWKFRSVAMNEKIVRKVLCTIFVNGSPISVESPAISMENDQKRNIRENISGPIRIDIYKNESNVDICFGNISLIAVMNKTYKFWVKIRSKNENTSVMIVCSGDGIVCFPKSQNLSVMGNKSIIFPIKFRPLNEGNHTLLVSTYINDSLVKLAKFNITVYSNNSKAGIPRTSIYRGFLETETNISKELVRFANEENGWKLGVDRMLNVIIVIVVALVLISSLVAVHIKRRKNKEVGVENGDT